jgi:hypothetical protein
MRLFSGSAIPMSLLIYKSARVAMASGRWSQDYGLYDFAFPQCIAITLRIEIAAFAATLLLPC